MSRCALAVISGFSSCSPPRLVPPCARVCIVKVSSELAEENTRPDKGESVCWARAADTRDFL